MKKEIIIDIGKWNLIFGLVPVYYRSDAFEFHFGFFKITSHPSEGEMITKRNYKGFWIRKTFRGFGFSKHF
jgi:hypothetical protein